MQLANGLTVLRILLAFVLLALLFLSGAVVKIAAFFVFLGACTTDYWDGRIARSRGQITVFGKLMDPIADKLLTLTAFIAFTQKGIVPAWMVVLVVARDFLITGIRLAVPQKDSVAEGRDLHVARISGKNKTVLQFVFILFVLGYLILKETSLWGADWESGWLAVIRGAMAIVVAATLWSGARYLVKNKRLFE